MVGRKKLLGGGYGRQMLNTSISNDMPEYFPNPERHPTVIKMNKERAEKALNDAYGKIEKSHEKRLKGQKKDSMESAYVLPGGMSALARKPQHNTRYKTYAYLGRHNQKMTLLEPLITVRKPEPLVWKDPPPQEFDFTDVLNSHHVQQHNHPHAQGSIHSNSHSHSYSQSLNSTGHDSNSFASGRRNPITG